MKNYEVTMLDKENYGEYMRGGYDYTRERVTVKADNEKKAIAIAKKEYPYLIIIGATEMKMTETERRIQMIERNIRMYEKQKADIEAELAWHYAELEELKKKA